MCRCSTFLKHLLLFTTNTWPICFGRKPRLLETQLCDSRQSLSQQTQTWTGCSAKQTCALRSFRLQTDKAFRLSWLLSALQTLMIRWLQSTEVQSSSTLDSDSIGHCVSWVRLSLHPKVTYALTCVVYPNQTIVVTIEAQTDTYVPMPMQTSVAINVINEAPRFDGVVGPVKVKIHVGCRLTIAYSNFWSAASALVSVSDTEANALYLTVSINGRSIVPNTIVLDSTSWSFEAVVDTSVFELGNYTMSLSLWDVFHDTSATQLDVVLEMKYFEPPTFASSFPDAINAQKWIVTAFELPQIEDSDSDYSHIRLVSNM